MKVIIIGGGIISKKLATTLPEHINLKCFSIRKLLDNKSEKQKIINSFLAADLIIYLAYHHRDLPKNISMLESILLGLKRESWNGYFVFFNTQSTLANIILKSPKALSQIFSFDLYTITKRLQSWLLERYSGYLKVCEIYLPVVLGPETKAQKRYENISKYKRVSLPREGKNIFAFIELDIFSQWFWLVFTQRNPKIIGGYRKVFVYQGVRTFGEMIMTFRKDLKTKKNIELNKFLDISNCLHKYRFSSSMVSNFLYGIKMSPIWLFLSILRNEIKKISGATWEKSELQNIPQSPLETFIPLGSEYQYFCTNIDLDAVPFTKVKVYL